MNTDEKAMVYRAVNGTPAENMERVLELMGGIDQFVGNNDVVMLKPNAQWWNQGAPNLAAIKALVDCIMKRSGGFQGEVVFAENCHRGASPWTSSESGWGKRFVRNSDLDGIHNLNDLGRMLKQTYRERFSICHLIDVEHGNPRVSGPEEGTGYVYCDGTRGTPLLALDNGCEGEDYRSVVMSYPIFRTDRGTIVDFCHGIWDAGHYTDQPFKFINVAALNHHGSYCGATSSIKNYMGISDLSGGPDPYSGGRMTETHYNFHSFPFNKWARGPAAGMLGAEVGLFLKAVRKADLNITTAEWVGLVSRTETPAARTRTVLASTDPVALDMHATKNLLYANSKIPVHNPEDESGPLNQYLAKCAACYGGVSDHNCIDVRSYDCRAKAVQPSDAVSVIGNKVWGSNLKMLAKYAVFRNWWNLCTPPIGAR